MVPTAPKHSPAPTIQRRRQVVDLLNVIRIAQLQATCSPPANAPPNWSHYTIADSHSLGMRFLFPSARGASLDKCRALPSIQSKSMILPLILWPSTLLHCQKQFSLCLCFFWFLAQRRWVGERRFMKALCNDCTNLNPYCVSPVLFGGSFYAV